MARLVSTLPFHKSPRWMAAVETVAARPARSPGRWRRLWQRAGVPDPGMVPQLLRRARDADALLLNGGERADLLYLGLAGLCPWIHAPHLILDAHWQPAASRLHRLLEFPGLLAGRGRQPGVRHADHPGPAALYRRPDDL